MATYANEQQLWGYGMETSFGSGGTPNTWPGIVQSFATKEERQITELRAGASFEPQQMAMGLPFTTKTSLDTIPQDGRLLFYAFNAGSTNVTGSPNNVHRLAISGSSAFPSMQFTTNRYGPAGNLVEAVTGLKAQKFTLKCDYKDMLHFAVDGVAKEVWLSGTAAAPTISTATPYFYAGGNLQINGVGVTEVRANEFSISRVLEEQLYQASGGGVTPYEISDHGITYEGTMTLNMSDFWKSALFAGYSGATTFQTLGSSINLAFRYAKSTNDYINVILSGCAFVSPGRDGDRTGVTKQTIKYKASNCFMDISDQIASGTGIYM